MNRIRRCLSALRKALIALILLGLLGGAAWGVWHWRGSGEHSVRFRTDQVTRGRVVALINASGTVVPEEVVDVGAQVGGRIVEFGEDPDRSHKPIDYRSRVEGGEKGKDNGTILAKIDDTLYEAEVKIARADLAVAQADVERTKAEVASAKAKADLAVRDMQRARRGGSAVSGLELDALTATVETSRAAVPAAEANLEKARRNVTRAAEILEKAEKNLRYTVIRSPVNGVIVDRRVNIGQTVVSSLNAPSLFLIAKDLKRMQVWVSVNEADIGRIQPGLPAYFKVDAYPDDVFTGVVGQIRLNATMTNNVVTYTVVVDTDNSNLRLLPYLTANLQFRVGQRDNALLLPNTALRYRPPADRVDLDYLADYERGRRSKPLVNELKPGKGGDNVGAVWVEQEDGYLRPVQVRLGLTDGVVTELIEGIDGELEEGDHVITGEVQTHLGAVNNPFAVKMFSGKKKD